MDFIRCPKKEMKVFTYAVMKAKMFVNFVNILMIFTKIIVQIDYFSVVLSFRKFDFWTRCVKSRKIIRHGSIKHNNLVRVYLQN